MLLLLSAPAAAGPSEDASPARPEELNLVTTGQVKEVLKPDLLLLDNDMRYRLENIRVPPYHEEPAIRELTTEFLGKTVRIYTYHHEEDSGVDRYGVPLVHILSEDGLWAQENLIAKGLAWVFTSETSHKMVEPLRKAEEKARAEKLGFWANPAFAIKTPESVKNYMHSFQIVEGKVLGVAQGLTTIFIHFGKSPEWKQDFTVELSKSGWSAFNQNSPRSYRYYNWEGKIMRIRGWVESKDGPMIRLTHPEQMEFIEPPKKASERNASGAEPQ
jgi:micrococcal nuclease